MPLTPSPSTACLVVLQIGTRRVATTVTWMEADAERVLAHRAVDCDWHTLGDRGRRQVVAESLALAAQSAGIEQIFSVFVSISDPSLRANFASGFVDLGQELSFTLDDRHRSLARATHQAIGTDRELLHALPQHWAVRSKAGEREVDNPVGERGSRLTCHVLLVTQQRRVREEVERLLADSEVAIEGLIAPPVGLYRGMVSQLPQTGSTIIIDMGARHTHLLVHRKSRLVHIETHVFGGADLDTLIARELGITAPQAEQLKQEVDITAHTRSTDYEGQTYLWREVQERHRMLGPAARICADALRTFFGERARTLRELELLAQRGKIHLVGRAAALGGLVPLVRDVFDLPVVLGTNTSGRELSTELTDLMTVGLVRQAAIERRRQLHDRQSSSIRQVTSMASSLWQWLMTPVR